MQAKIKPSVGDLVICNWQPRARHYLKSTKKITPLEIEIVNQIGIFIEHRNENSGYVFFGTYNYIHPLSYHTFDIVDKGYLNV